MQEELVDAGDVGTIELSSVEAIDVEASDVGPILANVVKVVSLSTC